MLFKTIVLATATPSDDCRNRRSAGSWYRVSGIPPTYDTGTSAGRRIMTANRKGSVATEMDVSRTPRLEIVVTRRSTRNTNVRSDNW